MAAGAGAQAAERTIRIDARYLNIPVSHAQPRHTLGLRCEGVDDLDVQVRIAPGTGEDYWVFKDLSRYGRGKLLTLTYDGPQEALDRLYQADTLQGGSQMYREALRPQFHFTTRRGWINDPNGLIWHEGLYHLFYQHNPYEREWGNMHWGHAVSRDLLHWEELDDALFPDETGTMFSGSAVLDRNNSSGFGSKKRAPLVLAYTADGENQTQCIAYSTDGGRTLQKFARNPVIDSHARWDSHDTRDPRLLWYAPGAHWVMVLCERDGHSFYTSDNLKDWTFRSHIRGFWECPDLFELPVDGDPSNTMWVLSGASGTYMIGDFDGFEFKPRGSKYRYSYGAMYAAQTYSEIPDGRRIQIGWGKMKIPGMPFNGLMLLPTQLTLRTTVDGVRIFSEPVREVQSLLERQYTATGDLSAEEANTILSRVLGTDESSCLGDGLHIHCRIALSYATSAGLDLDGQHLVDYDTNQNLVNGHPYSAEDPTAMEFETDIYVDRTSVELFVDSGALSCSFPRSQGNRRDGLHFWGREITVRELSVDRVKSIWQ